MERMRRNFMHGVLAALVAAALCAYALAADDANAATASATSAKASTKQQVKKLKRRIDRLEQLVAEVSKEPGPAGPEGPAGPPGPATGPAGGDLTGSFPNPLIGQGAVGATEIENDSITSRQIADHTINDVDLTTNVVGGSSMKGVFTVTSPGTSISAGTARDASVSCPPDTVLLSGGFAWGADAPSYVIGSSPDETYPRTIWRVRGMVPSGSNTLYAWASCLQA